MHALQLVDIRHEPTRADDIAMANFYRQMGIPFTVVATKADKISRGARSKQLAPICRGMLVQPWEVLLFSAEDGTGREGIAEKNRNNHVAEVELKAWVVIQSFQKEPRLNGNAGGPIAQLL